MAKLAKIEKLLKSKNISYKLIDLSGEVFTVDGVKNLGVAEEEIVKTLIIRTSKMISRNRTKNLLSLKNGHFVALALRGSDRVDFKKVRRLFGPSTSLRVNCELAKPEEVEKIVGVPVGAVCPVAIEIPIYFDKKVMDLKHVNMGSGDLTCGLEMDFEDLLAAVGNYQIEDLVVG